MNSKREQLKLNKPKVYEKVIKFDEKIARGESIGIIQLQYDYTCNLKCQHCSIKEFQDIEGRQKITPFEVEKIFDEAHELGLARVTISGGEPLVFRYLDEIVKAIGADRFYINMDSNGMLLTREKAKHLKSIGIDRIQLSIDSLIPDEHDNFRGVKGSWLKALKGLIAVKESGLDIFMQTCVTRTRLHSQEFLDYLKFFNNLDVSVFVSFAKPVGAFAGHFDELVTKSDLEYMKQLEKEYQVFTHLTAGYGLDLGCPAGTNIFSITQHGDVLICPYFHCSMGNLFEESLKDIMARMSSLKAFKGKTCFLAQDKEFIDKYLVGKIYNKQVPVDWQEVFNKEDFEL
jgi:MoaA/NifB/PqqE/SkfB family radical SAM enzyme